MRLRDLLCVTMLGLQPTVASAADWTYDDDYTGQEDWAAIRDEYRACGEGFAQSPVRIGDTQVKALPALTLPTGNARVTLRQVDYTLEIAPGKGQWLKVDGRRYALEWIRVHYPSEHMIGEMYYLFELQARFVDKAGHALHVATFVNIGKNNPAVDTVLANARSDGETATATLQLDDLFPGASSGYYAYDGSLTTPPCTEGVKWRVMKQPIEISDTQRERLFAIIGRNTRLPQPLYFRTVYETKN